MCTRPCNQKISGKDIEKKNLRCLQLFAANERRWTGPRTASPPNSILRVPVGLTPTCKTRGFRRFAIHRPNTRLLFQIPISCKVSRVDSSEGTLSQMLGPPRIPTKLSAEARSRPFEDPVITVRLPGESRRREGTWYR